MLKRRANSTQASESPARTVEVLGHTVSYRYRDGYAGEMDAMDRDHLVHMIGKEGWRCGEFTTADPQDPRKGHVGWWEIQQGGLSTLAKGEQRVEVLNHFVIVSYTDGWSGTPNEADEDYIAEMISGGYREGELYTSDPTDPSVSHRGWWRIDSGEEAGIEPPASSAAIDAKPIGLRQFSEGFKPGTPVEWEEPTATREGGTRLKTESGNIVGPDKGPNPDKRYSTVKVHGMGIPGGFKLQTVENDKLRVIELSSEPKFKDGDRVSYTNPQGVKFTGWTITGVGRAVDGSPGYFVAACSSPWYPFPERGFELE